MHYYGDNWFKKNGEDLFFAIDYCCKIWRKYGRIEVHGKEKYGTFRDELMGFWDGGLHSLIYPGYVSIQSNFIYKLDKFVIKPITRLTKIYKLGQLYQHIIYNYAIQKMCKKYPHIIDELVMDLDGYEIIKPCIFGKVDGINIYKKYWK